MKQAGKAAGFLIAVMIVVVLGASLVITYPNEYTVIKQFGKIESIRSEAGLSLKIPFIQTAEKIEKRCFYMTLR